VRKWFRRREWVANVADPTTVVQWTSRRLGLVLVGSWGVEAKWTVGGRTWRTYDHPLFVWLFDRLESSDANRA